MALFPGVRSGSGSNDPDAGYAGYDARVTPWYALDSLVVCML